MYDKISLIKLLYQIVLIYRYFSKELINTLLTVTLIVLIIFLGNQFIRYLNDAAAGNMALGVLGRLLLLEIPYLLAVLLPITFFISLLLALGRLSADNELVVLKACGLTPMQQWKMIAKPCILLVCLIAILSLWIQPKIALYRNQLLATTNAGASIQTLVPGKFQAAGNGRFVFYVEQSSVDHKHLHNIFIAEKRLNSNKDYSNGTQWNLIKAQHGQLIEDPISHADFVDITNGQRYVGDIGTRNFDVMQFARYLILARNPPVTAVGNQMDSLSTLQLMSLIRAENYKSYDALLAAAELEWRFSLPIACLLLAIFALWLGEVPPRQGRYAKLFPGILILIIYTNFLFVSRGWVSSGTWHFFPGMGWIHLLMLALIVACLVPWKRLKK